MAVPMDTQCLMCVLRRNIETARKLGDEKTATAFAKELAKAFGDMKPEDSSPVLGPATTALYEKYYGLPADRFRDEKEQSNRFVLERLEEIADRVRSAQDPILAGLQYAILGNYIDFSALQGKVNFRELDQMLEEAEKMELDPDNLRDFRQDLKAGRRLLYLTDNAGEICFDRVFAQELARQYPQLEITFCVRGGPALNDATREDARLARIPFPVIDSGSTVAGTVPELLGQEARQAMDGADIIIAKGQGNVETLFGSGYNVYYGFLIKCPRFEALFGKPRFTPMLVRDRQSHDILTEL